MKSTVISAVALFVLMGAPAPAFTQSTSPPDESTFRKSLEAIAAEQGKDALVGQVISFILAGSRPLTMAVRRSEAGSP